MLPQSLRWRVLDHAPEKPKPRTSAMSSDAPAVKLKAEAEWGKKKRR